jgi:cold shock CspA family protein
MSSNTEFVTPSASASRLIGRVKWFNNKAGYGFITVTDGTRSGTDIFVHHSAIMVENQQYKYLVQGEYVEFSESATSSGTHEYQASYVLGVKGGKLMCETRREFKIARSSYKTARSEGDNNGQEQQEQPRQQEPRQQEPRQQEPRQKSVRARGEGPRDGSDKKDWTLVKKRTDAHSRKPAPRKAANVVTVESK